MKSMGHSDAQISVKYVGQRESMNEGVKWCGLKRQSYDWH